MTTTHTCATCGDTADVLALTPDQLCDTDALGGEFTDAELVAEGARWLCIPCVNEEEDDR